MAFCRRDGRGNVEPAEIVARRGLDEQERRGRDDDHEEYREQQPPSQVRQEGAVHDGVFGSRTRARYVRDAVVVSVFSRTDPPKSSEPVSDTAQCPSL